MACITDARIASEPLNEMNYDIVVQGPNGNSRISRSVATKDINPEEVFPSEFVFNAEEEESDDVAAPAATQDNIARGFQAIKSFEFRKLEVPPPPPAPTFQFKSFDADAVKTRFADLRSKIDERILSHPLPEVQPLPAVSVPPLPALPKVSHPPHIRLPEPPTPAPLPAPPAGNHFKNLREMLSKPLTFKETITVTH